MNTPAHKRLRLLAHQRDSVAFALPRRACYLGLDPGLGKTATAACILASWVLPSVYITPPFLVRNIEAEFQKWAPYLSLLVWAPKVFDFTGVDVLIVPDSYLDHPRLVPFVLDYLAARPGALVVDEAHRFKEPKSKRTRALFSKLAPLFYRRVYMSGTPMPNRPMELYTVLSNEAPDTVEYMSVFDFGRKYCAGFRGRFGWDFSGASNMRELQWRVRGMRWPFMLRLRKELLNLPPITEELFILSDDMSPKLAAMDLAVKTALGDKGRTKLKERIALAENKTPEALHTATYRRLVGMEKVRPSAEYVNAVLSDSRENILLFAYHVEVIAALAVALKKWKPLIITGSTPVKKRHDLVNTFQTTNARLFIGNYHAMGVGFTLTKANRVMLVEFDWVPGVNDQAGGRAHRIGQDKSVLVQYFVYKNSVDKSMIEAILKKRSAIEHI